LGQQARESLLLCVSLCSKSPALEQYIAHQSNFCTILATGTSPYCLSHFMIPDPRIQKQQQKRGVKKFCCPTFFVTTNIKKIENYLIFELVKKKMWATSQRIIEFFTQKLSLSSQKYRFGIRDPEKPISGSRIRIRNTDFMR
jgi:hypothetical protein